MKKEKYTYNDLLDIMKTLRSPGGCPWDAEQTHESLKKYLIEETYEVLEAIDLKDKNKVCEELGDVLLQVVFHSKIAEDNGDFDMSHIVDGVARKMVMRHEHVFGDAKADSPDQVVDLWEKIKKKEKGAKTQTHILKDVPSNLPALMRSYKVQKKAAQVGFDWDRIEDAFAKVKEESTELEEVYTGDDLKKAQEELGDLLFATVNVARFLKISPELALNETTQKFIRRFEYVETEAAKAGNKLEEMTLKSMDKLWDKAKEEGL